MQASGLGQFRECPTASGQPAQPAGARAATEVTRALCHHAPCPHALCRHRGDSCAMSPHCLVPAPAWGLRSNAQPPSSTPGIHPTTQLKLSGSVPNPGRLPNYPLLQSLELPRPLRLHQLHEPPPPCGKMRRRSPNAQWPAPALVLSRRPSGRVCLKTLCLLSHP